MILSDDDIRAIVARADELQRNGDLDTEDFEALIRSGEELGISRSAMQRALLERQGFGPEPAISELVFGRSADENFYAAEVLRADDHTYSDNGPEARRAIRRAWFCSILWLGKLHR